MSSYPEQTTPNTELAPSQNSLFIENELRQALQHLAVASAFIDVDGIDGVLNHEALTTGLIQKIGAISGLVLSVETITPDFAEVESTFSIADEIAEQTQIIVPIQLEDDSEDQTSYIDSQIDITYTQTNDQTDSDNQEADLPSETETINEVNETIEEQETATESLAPQTTSEEEEEEEPELQNQPEPEQEATDLIDDFDETFQPIDEDPLTIFAKEFSLSERDTALTKTMLLSTTPGSWFQRNDIDLSNIEFVSQGALQQAFSKYTLMLIDSGLLEADGVRSHRKYKLSERLQALALAIKSEATPDAHQPEPSPQQEQTSDHQTQPALTDQIITVRLRDIRIGDEHYNLKHGEFRYLNKLKDAGQPTDPESLTAMLLGIDPKDVSEEQLDQTEDYLVDLHKRGILKEEVEFSDGHEIAHYSINHDIADTLTEKQRVVIDREIELYLDDFDLEILQLVHGSRRPVTLPELARTIGDVNDGLPKPEFDRMVRTIKKYFISQGVMRKISSKGNDNFKPKFEIKDNQRENVSKALARLPRLVV